MDKKELLQKYAENLSNSENRDYYMKYARDYLDQADETGRDSIDQYLGNLRQAKRKPGTVNFAFRIIRRLYAVNGLPWEYRRGEAPPIGQRDEYRPQLSPQVVKMMVDAAKANSLYPEEACFLTLSTTYGLRREEMVNLKPEDIKLSSNAIYIATIKFGRERYHLIPPEIKPYLANHDFRERYAVGTMSQMFKRILLKAGAGELRKERLGWHTIRRAAFDGVVNNGVNPMAARIFFRWKSAYGEMAMPARYFGNVVIGLKGHEPVLEEAKGDEEIFEKHPFLGFWRD